MSCKQDVNEVWTAVRTLAESSAIKERRPLRIAPARQMDAKILEAGQKLLLPNSTKLVRPAHLCKQMQRS